MWPFSSKRDLPGIKRESNGELSFTLTAEEEAEVQRFFSAMKTASEDEGELYIHPDAHRAMTAWALIGYSQSEVFRAENADPGVLSPDECISKALAAVTKAYSLHPLPIYMFDMGCIFEMCGEKSSAESAFSKFLELQRQFRPSDVDKIVLQQRDIEEAVRYARATLMSGSIGG